MRGALAGPTRGWALISTAVTANTQGTGWGASELIAVQIDTLKVINQTWCRIGRAFSIRNTQYYAEPDAVPNRDFTKVIWGSDWLVNGGEITPFQITLAPSPVRGPGIRGGSLRGKIVR